jgi:hypothetical protein
MTFLEAQTYLIENKLNGDYDELLAGTNSLFSLAVIKTAIQLASKRAWDYRAWPFSKEVLKLTYVPPVSGEYYEDYPNTYADEAIEKLKVNGLEWGKRNFDDYQLWLANNPTSTQKIWSTYKRFWFANKNALTASDEIAIDGKLKAPSLSADADLLPFSPDFDDNEDSGNHAIVRLAFADLMASEKKKEYQLATTEEKAAFGMLDVLWAPMAERKAREQSQDRPFFDVPDFFPPSDRGRGPTNIGNFP